MNLIVGILLIIGILCLLYFTTIVAYAGITVAFAWFWLVAGLSCIFVCIYIRYMMLHNIKITGVWRLSAIAVIMAGLFVFILIEGTLIYHSNRTAEQNMDYMIVLGAQVRGTTVTKALQKRLDTAAIYLIDNPRTKVIVSGGQGSGEDVSEAEAMKLYLMGKGIEEIRITKEDKSTSTNENIRFSKVFIEENSSVVIVTNGFHIFRSISIAKKQGITQAQGLAAPSDPVLSLNYYVREVLGVLKDKLKGNL